MKIAYVLTTYPCPSETFIQREIKQLKKKGFDISVFASESKAEESLPIQDLHVYYRPSLFYPSAVWSIISTALKGPFRLVKLTVLMIRLLVICPKEAGAIFVNFHTICFFAKIAKKEHTQHIHACFLSWPACIGLCVSTLTGLPFSISAHARDIFIEHGASELKVRHAKFVVCCSSQGVNCLKKQINPRYYDRLFLNYHGISIDTKIDFCNIETKSVDIVLAAGRLVPKKGFDCLLKAFAKVIKGKPEIKLIIAGQGPEKENLSRLAVKLHIEHKVYLAGWLNHADVLKLIEQAAVLVVPSVIDDTGDRDGIPNVILESFCLGTPVIASSLAGITEVIKHEYTGLLVETGNIEQLAFAIRTLLSNRNLCVRFSTNAYKTVRKNFDPEITYRRLANLFDNVNYENR
jgi:colanic acid/amylovoran biosynthesis glycosyltransferase